MKVLLTTLNAKYIHLNLAIRLLYSLNKDKHHGLSFKEFTIKESPDLIADYCKDFDIVTFSCYIWNITPTLVVAKKIKELNPSIKILLGGPEVSYEYDEVIAQPYIDYIIVGEGEIPMQSFLDLETLQLVLPKDELKPILDYVNHYSRRYAKLFETNKKLKTQAKFIRKTSDIFISKR